MNMSHRGPLPADPEVDAIVRALGLVSLPQEGGLYAETYRSARLLPAGAAGPEQAGPRACATAIYYLVTPTRFSALHRVASTEIFHFYLGDPVRMVQLHPDGSTSGHVIGVDILAGQRPQVVARRGVWQGTRLLAGGRFALLGCTVSPGFDFADYEHGSRAALMRAYPHAAQEIEALTPDE
ncbi:MAG: cupin domain-containing protein [Humidesulfovibrio sp.]|nr:cupin domain-containing protein [Humidesulfovibrio sp.]